MGVKREAKLNAILATMLTTSLRPFIPITCTRFCFNTEINCVRYDLTNTTKIKAKKANPMYSQKLVVQKSAPRAKYLKNMKFKEKNSDDNAIKPNTCHLNLNFFPLS